MSRTVHNIQILLTLNNARMEKANINILQYHVMSHNMNEIKHLLPCSYFSKLASERFQTNIPYRF